MKYLKYTILAFSAGVACAFAGETNDVITLRSGRKITREELHQKVEISRNRRTGGIIRKEGSAAGRLVVLNAQKTVATDSLKDIWNPMSGWISFQMEFKDVPALTLGNIGEVIRKSDGAAGVGLVEDPSLPMLVTAPEAGWALVNVAKIAEDGPDAKTLASRVRKEVLRGIAFVTGCAYMTRGDPLMRDVVKPSDLDALPLEMFGAEIINHMRESAQRYGIKPWYVTTYLKACEEGWAPQPTNDYQKAIWEKVHAIPQKPIKIEFDPKTDKK